MSYLSEKQQTFTWLVQKLIFFAYEQGYGLTFGDAFAKSGHCKGSYHYKRLAIDFNLFKDGKYLTKTEDYRLLGEYWESIGGTWGGRFKHKDGNHFSYGE